MHAYIWLTRKTSSHTHNLCFPPASFASACPCLCPCAGNTWAAPMHPEGERSRSLRVPVEGTRSQAGRCWRWVPRVSWGMRASRGSEELSQNGSNAYHKKAFVSRKCCVKNHLKSSLLCRNSFLFRSDVFFLSRFKSANCFKTVQNWHYGILFFFFLIKNILYFLTH